MACSAPPRHDAGLFGWWPVRRRLDIHYIFGWWPLRHYLDIYRNAEKPVAANQCSGSGQVHLAPLLSSPMTADLTHGSIPPRAERRRLVVLHGHCLHLTTSDTGLESRSNFLPAWVPVPLLSDDASIGRDAQIPNHFTCLPNTGYQSDYSRR